MGTRVHRRLLGTMLYQVFDPLTATELRGERELDGGINLRRRIRLIADEFWSSVGNTSPQRWTGSALDHANGVILAHQHGRRPDTVCEQLFNKVEMFPVKTMYTNA